MKRVTYLSLSVIVLRWDYHHFVLDRGDDLTSSSSSSSASVCETQ